MSDVHLICSTCEVARLGIPKTSSILVPWMCWPAGNGVTICQSFYGYPFS